MEVTAAERTTIYTNISPLAQRVNNYIQTQHSSIAAVAKDIGYSRTTVSRYLTGKYDSNPNDLESKLTDFLTRQTGEAVDRRRRWRSQRARRGRRPYSLRAGTRRPCSVYARAVRSTLASAS